MESYAPLRVAHVDAKRKQNFSQSNFAYGGLIDDEEGIFDVRHRALCMTTLGCALHVSISVYRTTNIEFICTQCLACAIYVIKQLGFLGVALI